MGTCSQKSDTTSEYPGKDKSLAMLLSVDAFREQKTLYNRVQYRNPTGNASALGAILGALSQALNI